LRYTEKIALKLAYDEVFSGEFLSNVSVW